MNEHEKRGRIKSFDITKATGDLPNDGLETFRWRGYDTFSVYLDAVNANIEAMNFSICLGFQIWYYLMPVLMQSVGYSNSNGILNPEVVNYIKDRSRDWSAPMIQRPIDLCDHMYNMIQVGTLERGGASSSVLGTIAESYYTGTFDPLLEIRKGEEVEYHKKVRLTKVVIACITVCILNSLFVTNACGTDLYQLYIDGMSSE